MEICPDFVDPVREITASKHRSGSLALGLDVCPLPDPGHHRPMLAVRGRTHRRHGGQHGIGTEDAERALVTEFSPEPRVRYHQFRRQ